MMSNQLNSSGETMLQAFSRYCSIRKESGEWGKLPCEATLGRAIGADDIYANVEYINLQPAWITHPDWSAFVPIAHTSEPIDLTTSVVDKIAESAKDGAGKVEINLWTNTRADNDDMAHSMRVFDTYVASLKKWTRGRSRQKHGFGPDRVRIRAVCMNDPDLDFNYIRAEGTAALAIDSMRRRIRPDHPIVWLDGDTPFMARDAIAKILTALRERKAHFVRGHLVLASDRGRIPAHKRPTEAEKIAGIYGLARQIIEEALDFNDPRGYVDESGLAFTVATYLLSGGVSVSDPNIGESKSLLIRGAQAQADNALDPAIPLIGFVKDAVIGNSDRRFVKLAQCVSPKELPQSVAGDDYLDYIRLEQTALPTRQNPVTESEVRQMVDSMFDRQKEHTPNFRIKPNRTAYLNSVISRCGFVSA